jgi:hypothetical protein
VKWKIWRLIVNWIDQVLKSTEESESPERFYYWSALCTIAAIVSPNIYLDRFYYKLSPNLYVFLIGESGIRKGPPIGLASSLVKQVDCTRVIKGRSTIQGIIKMMGKAVTLGSGEVLNDSRVFLPIGEFAAGLIQDPQGVSILTELYDTYYNEDWDNTLSTVPVNKLLRPCITLFAASNETNLSTSLPEEAIQGGFIARSLVIEEKKRRTVNSLAFAPKYMLNTKDLCRYLLELKKLEGEVKYDNGAALFYKNWYDSFVQNAPKDKTGTINRVTDTILKVAMLIQLSKEPVLILKTESIEEAIEQCLLTISGMKRVTMGYGKGELATTTKIVLMDLIKKFPDGVKKSNLLSNHWGEFDSIDLDRVIENLDQSQAINIEIVSHGNKKEYSYKLKYEVYVQYTQYLQRKEGIK